MRRAAYHTLLWFLALFAVGALAAILWPDAGYFLSLVQFEILESLHGPQ